MSLLDLIAPGIGPIIDIVGKVIDRVIPDKEAARKAKDALAEEALQADVKGMLAQLDINKVEAASSSIFVAGWRPFIGWVGGAGFAVQFVVVPLLGYGYSLFGHAAPPVLELDPILYEVVFGILGINIGARSYDKIKGVDTKVVGVK